MSISTPIAIAVEVACIGVCIWIGVAVVGWLLQTFSHGDRDR